MQWVSEGWEGLVFRKAHHVLIPMLPLDLCCWFPRAASLIHYGILAPHRLILRKLCAGEVQPDCLIYGMFFLLTFQ